MASLRTWGEPDAPIMLILEAPTQDDMEAGMLLRGWVGRFLQKGLEGQYQAVSLFDTPLSKPPTAAQMGTALPAFQAALAARSTRIIVPLGSAALEAVLGSEMTNIMDWRGYFIKPDPDATIHVAVKTETVYKTARPATKTLPAHAKGDPRWINQKIKVPVVLPAGVEEILPTLTPQTVQKTGLTLMSTVYGDLHKAVEFVGGLPPEEPYNLQFTNTPIETNRLLAVDIENDYDGAVTEIGLATEFGVSTTRMNGKNYGLFDDHFRECKILIAHNAAHEFAHLSPIYPLGHIKLWDTMLAAYMLEPDGKKSLNWVISQYMATRRHKHLSSSRPELYNALDVEQTHKLYSILRNRLNITGQLNFFEGGMMPAIPTLTRMTQRGLLVDKAYAVKWRQELLDAAGNIWEEMTSQQRMLCSSPKKLAAYFGVRNSDEEQLLKLKAAGHPETNFIDTILARRATMKKLDYCQRDTYVHPSYLPGTRDTDDGNKGIAYSGRPTASGPNIQNQPPDARRQFISRPGHKLISLDWSQIEPRIIAALSGDDVLAADIEFGLYDAVAGVLSCPRSVAKTVVLLSAYLGSPQTLQNKLMLAGIVKPLRECKALQENMFSRYKSWKRWRENVINAAQAQRFLRNCFGKQAPFVRPHPAKAVNFHPQSTAACILWYCLPEVEQVIKPFDATIVTTVHDEILLEVPDGQEIAAIEAARTVMNAEWPEVASGWRVPVKAKVGLNWRDMLELSNPWNAYEGL